MDLYKTSASEIKNNMAEKGINIEASLEIMMVNEKKVLKREKTRVIKDQDNESKKYRF